MNTTSTEDRSDEQLRALLAQADPERGAAPGDTEHLLARVRADALQPPAEVAASPATRPSWLHRHWQGSLLVAASVATLALAAPTVLPSLTGGGNDTAQIAATDETAAGQRSGVELPPSAALGGADSAEELAVGPDSKVQGSLGGAAAEQEPPEASLVRSASLLVGSENVEAARATFVARILALGGRVTSETVVTEGAGGGRTTIGEQDLASTSPGFPWYPTGPGVWLSVEVPVASYEEAIDAARQTGEVVRSEQSSYDVGTQIADVEARIAALEASLARLTDLMSQADGVNEVIQLEQAIASRQAELDALGARQRELTNQTEMSRLSLTLMSPEDARAAVDPDPQPQQTWWESLVSGLGQFWAWLGRSLLIVSPLLVAAAIIWWVRRRSARAGGPGASRGTDESVPPTRPESAEPETDD